MIFPYFCTPKSNIPNKNGQKEKKMKELERKFGVDLTKKSNNSFILRLNLKALRTEVNP